MSSLNYKAIWCVVGAVLINLTLGTFYSYSNIVPYVASYMRKNGNPTVTLEQGPWLTAGFLLGQGLSVIFGSWIEGVSSSRVAAILGCIIHCTSTYLAMWAVKKSFLALILVYGFGSGIGSGSAYMASIIAAQKWFPSNKGISTGIIVAGFGFGGFIFTNLQTLYMNPNNMKVDATGYFQSKEVFDKVPNLFLYMGIIFTVAQSIGCLLASPAPISSNESSAEMRAVKSPVVVPNVTMDEGLPEIRNALSPFSYRIFYVIGLMMALIAPGVTFVNSLGKPYGQTFIQDDQYLATVVAVSAIANAGGRLTWGYLVDRFTFSSCFSVKCLLFAFLISLFPFGFILSSKYVYMLWMFGLFFGFSGSFVLFPVFIEQVFGSKYSGFIYGILFIAFALSSILTSFLIQIVVGKRLSDPKTSADDKLYVRLAPCALIATSYLVSLVIYFFALPVRRIENAIKRRKEADTMKYRRSLFNRSDLYPMERGTLAEKTAAARVLNQKSEPRKSDTLADDALRKENSLGSIVKYVGNTTVDEGRIKTFGLPNTFKVL